MTPDSKRIIALARRVVEPYVRDLGAVAAMVSGSAAEGIADRFSDLDMMVYYNALPSDEEVDAARLRNVGSERIWATADREGGGFAEAYTVEGVEVQIAHATVSAVDRDMAVVLEKLEVDTPLQKALSGILVSISLHGDAQIRRWKDRAAGYPDALAEAMVKHYLRFFPIWIVGERLSARDAALWLHQIRVETLQNLLGVLAGLNRLYYTTFQFKRTAAFVGQMRHAPQDLARRLEAVLAAPMSTALDDLERLVRETVDLVEAHMPQADTSAVRARLTKS